MSLNNGNSLFPPTKKGKLTLSAILLVSLGYLVELRTQVAIISNKVDRIENTIDKIEHQKELERLLTDGR